MFKSFSNTIICCLLISVAGTVAAQVPSGTVKGKVADRDSKFLIPGAIIKAGLSGEEKGTVSDEKGIFKITELPIGRIKVTCTMLGYLPFETEVIIASGKENVLEIELTESSSTLGEVVITGSEKTEAVNEMSLISTRSFSAEETERYAATRQDPARMVSVFAGVQGTDDGRNDIVIRGNSPLGLLWRLEDVDIPNPNHFAVAGSSGGPISILNNKTIGRSDFLTGAFASEYGNAISGVFDLKLRPGNSEKHEFTGQLGLWGTELMAEGPLSKKSGASYLAAYRYSTLKLFDAANINVGTNALPVYQDFTFKFNLPTAKYGVFTVFGIGGLSNIDIIVSDFTGAEGLEVLEKEQYGVRNRDQRFATGMGVGGVGWLYSFNKNTYAKITLYTSLQGVSSHHDLVLRDSSFNLISNWKLPKLDYRMNTGKSGIHAFVNHKFSPKWVLKTGVIADVYTFDFTDSIYNENTDLWVTRLNFSGSALTLQPYSQLLARVTDKFSATAGIHAQYLTLGSSYSVEPRVGVSQKIGNRQSVSAGAGLHSQMQPSYVYFANADGGTELYNRNLGFTRSLHTVAGYDYVIRKDLRIKVETYYQYLFQIPVDTGATSYSVINQGSGFDRFFPGKLVNEGTGENYGAELTVEKFFSKRYFFLVSASIFDSKYKGSDGISRNTDYNGRFATNWLTGYELPVGKSKSNALKFGTRVAWAGGRRYSPANREESLARADYVEESNSRNSLQFANYFRTDINLGYKINRLKATHEIAVDIFNLTDHDNYLRVVFDPNVALAAPERDPLIAQRQLGRLPMFYYKIQF